jgi:hypothetical protein
MAGSGVIRHLFVSYKEVASGKLSKNPIIGGFLIFAPRRGAMASRE